MKVNVNEMCSYITETRPDICKLVLDNIGNMKSLLGDILYGLDWCQELRKRYIFDKNLDSSRGLKFDLKGSHFESSTLVGSGNFEQYTNSIQGAQGPPQPPAAAAAAAAQGSPKPPVASFCGFCGEPFDDLDSFCIGCGAQRRRRRRMTTAYI